MNNKKNRQNSMKSKLTPIGAMLLGVLALYLSITGLCASTYAATNAPVEKTAVLKGVTVVVDAGHGGSDGGTVGRATQTREADVNISIALLLEEELQALGATVVMTRKDEGAIGNTKNADMQKRREIIGGAEQDFTISIHQNSFGDAAVSGPQVIYAPSSEQGKVLAEQLQQRMNDILAPKKPRVAAGVDKFITNSGAAPAVIVECGFMSNAEEEALLLKPSYQKKIVDAIVMGVVDYSTQRAS